jgi:hypothetical protein
LLDVLLKQRAHFGRIRGHVDGQIRTEDDDIKKRVRLRLRLAGDGCNANK